MPMSMRTDSTEFIKATFTADHDLTGVPIKIAVPEKGQAATTWYLTEVLGAKLDDTVRFRGSLGFLLVAIDHLAHLNESYGFDAAEEVIAQVAKRIRERLRGKDFLGRFSGNKFGVILTTCTADELAVAADRLLAGVRDETVPTVAGPVAVTVTIGGITAPRHARTVPEILIRAQDALHAARRR